jgi:hypothetical protein
MYGTPTNNYNRVRRDTGASAYRVEQRSNFEITDIATTADPTIHIYRSQPSGDPVFDLRRLGVNYRYNTTMGGPVQTLYTHLYWIGSKDQFSLRGKASLLALYDRFLTDEETIDLLTLCQYWIDNGEAPTLGPPTSGDFTIAVDKPGAAGIAYQWEESADGNSWANAGTILSDISGATTDTLTINSATVAMHNTQVRCQVTTDNDGFDTSDSALLLIDGEALQMRGKPPANSLRLKPRK